MYVPGRDRASFGRPQIQLPARTPVRFPEARACGGRQIKKSDKHELTRLHKTWQEHCYQNKTNDPRNNFLSPRGHHENKQYQQPPSTKRRGTTRRFSPNRTERSGREDGEVCPPSAPPRDGWKWHGTWWRVPQMMPKQTHSHIDKSGKDVRDALPRDIWSARDKPKLVLPFTKCPSTTMMNKTKNKSMWDRVCPWSHK